MKTVLALCLAVVTLTPAHSQGVWRCGPEGRTYADTPCAEGRQVTVADPRTDTERAAAQAVVQREQHAIARLSGERREREAEAIRRGTGPAGIKPLPVPRADKPAASQRADARKAHPRPKRGAASPAPRYAATPAR